MKDPKNIEVLNKLVMNYITLHGLQNIQLDPNDPFAVYFLKVLSSGMLPIGGASNAMVYSISNDDISAPLADFYVPNSMFHPMIKMAYDFYQKVDDIDSIVNPMMKEQIKQQLGDIDYEEFVEKSVDTFKTCLCELLDNYNSKREDYNEIKLEVFNLKMQEAVEIEDYETAAEMRDKIADFKSTI